MIFKLYNYPFLAEAPFYYQFGREGLILLAISERTLCVSHSQFCQTKVIPAPSHCRVFHEKFRSLLMLLTDLLFNRHHFVVRILGGGWTFLYLCPKHRRLLAKALPGGLVIQLMLYYWCGLIYWTNLDIVYIRHLASSFE